MNTATSQMDAVAEAWASEGRPLPSLNITHPEPDAQAMIEVAWSFAVVAHGNQARKYTGEPYVTHCLDVAGIVAEVTDSPEAVCAALLHDVIEDTPNTAESLLAAGFNEATVSMVVDLTEVAPPAPGLNRAKRKAMDRQHLAGVCPLSQTVKLADMISNSPSIIEHDPGFARIYIDEMAALVDVLTDGNPELHRRASAIIDDYLHVKKGQAKNHHAKNHHAKKG